ncbi:hypothetical protein OAT16_09930 [Prolixibacteraceae bacterium]|nr:hypothetical protein [Prolixibacteraceae bacterium]
MKDKQDIELRSEKVRNIIGKIPPLIIRLGISTISLIVIFFITTAFCYHFEEKIYCNSTLYPHNGKIRYEIAVPSNKINKVLLGQDISFHLQNTSKSTSTVTSIDSVIHINKKEHYYNVTGVLKIDKIILDEKITVPSTISIGRVNIVDYVFGD